MDSKLLAKEVLIKDDDFVIECKLSAEIKLTLFYLINYQLCSFLVLCINLNVFFQNGVRETPVLAVVGNLGLLALHLYRFVYPLQLPIGFSYFANKLNENYSNRTAIVSKNLAIRSPNYKISWATFISQTNLS